MKMILLAVFALLMVQQSGTMDQSLKHSNEEQSCSLTRSTSPLTKFSVSRASLKEMESSLRRLESLSNPVQVSTSSQPQTLKVKVQMTDDSLELTCSTKLFLERFPVTFEQTYPAPASEQKIL